jgi:multidrug transporter EmrE-like cation transporter
MNAYTYLAIAICAEVIATASMKAVKGLSTPLPLLLMICGYGVAFWISPWWCAASRWASPTPSGRGWASC